MCRCKPAEAELVYGEPATTLTTGQCGDDCTECRWSWWSNATDVVKARCVDTTVYKYGAICPDTWDRIKCMSGADQFCHKSYPHGDPDKMNSVNATCRTVADSYIYNDFTYNENVCGS
jgi:hypothetical protein